jgi:hypothetical protein
MGILDISSSPAIARVDHCFEHPPCQISGPDIESIAKKGDLLFLGVSGGDNEAIYVVDVSNKAFPNILTTYNLGNNVSSYVLCVEGQYLYSADVNILWVLDISNPLEPVTINQYPGLIGPSWLGVPRMVFDFDQDLAIMGSGSTIRIVDISDPLSLSAISSFNYYGTYGAIGFSGNQLVDAGAYLSVGYIFENGVISPGGQLQGMHTYGNSAVIRDNYAFVAADTFGLLTFDLSGCCGICPDDTEICDGVSQAGTHAAGTWAYYYIDVPSNVMALDINVEVSSGLIDGPHMRHIGKPDMMNGVNTSHITNPQPERWWVGLKGVDSGSHTITAIFIFEPCVVLDAPGWQEVNSSTCDMFVTTSSNSLDLSWEDVANEAGYTWEMFNGQLCEGAPELAGSTATNVHWALVSSVSLGSHSWHARADGDGIAYCDSAWSACCEVLVIESEVFSDGFESGDTSSWSWSVQ